TIRSISQRHSSRIRNGHSAPAYTICSTTTSPISSRFLTRRCRWASDNGARPGWLCRASCECRHSSSYEIRHWRLNLRGEHSSAICEGGCNAPLDSSIDPVPSRLSASRCADGCEKEAGTLRSVERLCRVSRGDQPRHRHTVESECSSCRCG